MDRMIIRWRALVLVCAVIIGAFVWAFSVNRRDLQETETHFLNFRLWKSQRNRKK